MALRACRGNGSLERVDRGLGEGVAASGALGFFCISGFDESLTEIYV